PSNIPGGADPSYGNWTSTDSTMTGAGYPACTLTYEMVFDDNAVAYCNSADEQAKARTIKDYMTKAVLSDKGQDELIKADYDRLPADAPATSRAAVAQIGWNKGGAGHACPDAPQPTPTPTATPISTPQPPAPPSNKVVIASSRVSGTTIRLSLRFPG